MTPTAAPPRDPAVRWEMSAGVPRIPAATGFVACVVDRLVEAGDHVLALGVVVAASGTTAEPLELS